MYNCLSIAGSDCSGGAGIQADIKTFSANGVFGMSVITSVVAENTCRVISVRDMDEEIIRDQIDAVFEDIRVDGVKLGMLSNAAIMNAVAEKLVQYRADKVVADPVMVAKGGCALMHPEALTALKTKIIPISYMLTPNIPEAETITGMKIGDVRSMREAAKAIFSMGAATVLVKGGHLDGEAVDVLYDGKDFHEFVTERINTKNTHGTGCTLSSAITANIAKGLEPEQAVRAAKDYVTMAIKHSLRIGRGHGPTNHFFAFFEN